MDGLKRGADSSTTISVQTLFTRTLRSLMFDNVPWFPLLWGRYKKQTKGCGVGKGWKICWRFGFECGFECLTFQRYVFIIEVEKSEPPKSRSAMRDVLI